MSQPTLDALQIEFKRRKALARLKAQLRAKGITHARVAQGAHVDPTLISNVLAGRAKSQNVVTVIKRLLAEAREIEAVREPEVAEPKVAEIV